MSEFSLELAKSTLKEHGNELPEGYLAWFESTLTRYSHRSVEDFREATKMAVDSSKVLFQIAIAVFVFLGGFVQYALNAGQPLISWPVGLLIGAGISTFLSMCVGFFAMGKTFKRAEGRIETDKPWSTEPIAGLLMWQSLLGVLALSLFASATVFWQWSEAGQGSATISAPDIEITTSKNNKPFVLTGTWSHLKIQQGGVVHANFNAVPTGVRRVIVISARE